MHKPKVLVLGLGEVGRPLYEIVAESGKFETYGYDIDPSKAVHKLEEVPAPIDVMHVCYPCASREEFVERTCEYVREFGPGLVIINSTVPPGTTEDVHRRTGAVIVHSPVRGIHARMKEHLKFWAKYVGPVSEEAARKAKEHFEALGMKVKVLKSPRETELAKLVETTYRALMIAWWQEVHRACRAHGIDVAGVADFIADTHKVLRDRPVYYPGAIGGHCLIPNTLLLKDFHPSFRFLNDIVESNAQRESELEDERVRGDVERVKRVWARSVPKWYFGLK